MTAREIVTLRMPPDLKKWVERQARRAKKSQNDVMVKAIEDAREAETK